MKTRRHYVHLNCAHLSEPNSNSMQIPIGGRSKCLPTEKRGRGGGRQNHRVLSEDKPNIGFGIVGIMQTELD